MRAVGCHRSATKLHIFPYQGSQDTTILVVTKTPTYPVMRQLPRFVALCDHNPPTLQMFGRRAFSVADLITGHFARSDTFVSGVI